MPQPASPPKAPESHKGPLPWLRLRSAATGPLHYRRMIRDADPAAQPGDLVAVYDKSDAPYGIGHYNPKSLISLRLLSRGPAAEPEALLLSHLERAIELRRDILKLDEKTDAYRLINAEGDGLSGLVVDRYADALSVEYYSLGMFRQQETLDRLLLASFPGARIAHRANEAVEAMEGFRVPSAPPQSAVIQENGVRFRVELASGYKTGFFCDQRDNRLGVAALSAGRKVLDVCSYTGGFGLYAKKLGGADEVTCVELDPASEAMARRNAGLNQIRVETVCADAFPYLRQMSVNERRYGLVVLDPYKFIGSKEEFGEGRQKYFDLNKLGMGLVEDGGILVSCSCSGQLGFDEFARIARGAAAAAGKRLQILRKSGAGADHPVAADFPEGEYLKVLWCRVFDT